MSRRIAFSIYPVIPVFVILMLLLQLATSQNFGLITTLAGDGDKAYYGDGGPAINAELDHPAAIVVDTAKNYVYVTDGSNHGRIRIIDMSLATPTINVVAGGTVCAAGYGW